MPNRSAAWVGKGPTNRTSRGGLHAALGVLGLCIAFAVTGCASASTGTPSAAEQQITTQSTPTPDNSVSASDSPSAADVTTAPATSAAPTTAPAEPAPPTSRAPAPARSTAPPKPSLCGAPQNPFGYNFCGRGGYIYSPAGTVCSYFDCIANFDNGSGYMVECSDGTYSMSGGRRGACSYHGGVSRPVYSG